MAVPVNATPTGHVPEAICSYSLGENGPHPNEPAPLPRLSPLASHQPTLLLRAALVSASKAAGTSVLQAAFSWFISGCLAMGTSQGASALGGCPGAGWPPPFAADAWPALQQCPGGVSQRTGLSSQGSTGLPFHPLSNHVVGNSQLGRQQQRESTTLLLRKRALSPQGCGHLIKTEPGSGF